MFKIIDIFAVGNMLSVSFEGNCEELKSGSRLTDNKGNFYNVISVAMTRHDSPEDISKSTNILISPNTAKLNDMLYIA